jgi:negative regulator of flagellin synthesis FlgM
MKINDNLVNYTICKNLPKTNQNKIGNAGEKKVSDGQEVEEKNQSGQDTVVNLSSALKEAHLIREIISSEPDVREEKVAELKNRIESGEYEINHEAVADKLVDSFIDELI